MGVCQNCGSDRGRLRKCTNEVLCIPCKFTDSYRLITRTRASLKYGFSIREIYNFYGESKKRDQQGIPNDRPLQMFTVRNPRGRFPQYYYMRLHYENQIKNIAIKLLGAKEVKRRVAEYEAKVAKGELGYGESVEKEIDELYEEEDVKEVEEEPIVRSTAPVLTSSQKFSKMKNVPTSASASTVSSVSRISTQISSSTSSQSSSLKRKASLNLAQNDELKKKK